MKHQLAAGVVLTGGAAQIDGIVECAQKIFNCQVRVGAPSGVQGLTDYVVKPAYSTGVGLLKYCRKHHLDQMKQYTGKTQVKDLFKKLVIGLRASFRIFVPSE